jgi:DoxX-like protein
MSLQPDVVARFLTTAFFAVVFLQSSLDKLFDWQGNLSYLSDHFKSSPIPAAAVPPMLMLLTLIELSAGLLCALGLLLRDFTDRGFGLAGWGLMMSGLALLCLLLGQRLAKDYAGAAVVAAYFTVVLVGLSFFLP